MFKLTRPNFKEGGGNFSPKLQNNHPLQFRTRVFSDLFLAAFPFYSEFYIFIHFPLVF